MTPVPSRHVASVPPTPSLPDADLRRRPGRGLAALASAAALVTAVAVGVPAGSASAAAPSTPVPGMQVPALKDVLGSAGIEHVGVAMGGDEVRGTSAALIQRHFNALTPENAGKADAIQPVEGRFDFTGIDQLLDFADAHGMKMYFHVDFWMPQTPAWFFLDHGRPLTNSPADQALLRARMEAHVKAISDHIASRYPKGGSPIWAMDVVNEVIDDGPNGNPHHMKDTRWFQVLGEGFVDEGFRLAKRYFPGVKLFINDYNTDVPSKRTDYLGLISDLLKRGVPVEGVSHQAHVGIRSSVAELRTSIEAVKALDPDLLEAISELDVSASQAAATGNSQNRNHTAPIYSNPDDTAAAVGWFYRDLFTMIRQEAGDLESVTFWGSDNSRSWLRGGSIDQPWERPLPFGDHQEAMPAYWGIVDPSRLPARPPLPKG
ncbi:endo-1,4-beta-xylanase [Clavibacter capsici]|uniref:Beta-xylanase n=1 Tax=Clavibacter capsici TaxID=1874630 RepID=A0A0M4HBU7_9MICO|nr:endo-1,4-beta-xylanase [Clavibacter capsici]ALD12876.1 endo-1,4-beta-xylanase A [Clavibacter capsici]QIS39258.1 endo-1,4-beta-xylanase [Clavibacter capsici]QIS42100.1 endo-1,4-beta-xylanase [Clavibacter capsici]QIS45047.1 endo-1,4-beta-xylanase [Clavibacter capsici]